MPTHLDHLVVVAPSLALGAQFVEHSLGVRPGPGRQHPHMGTHNLLLSLGPSVYLEVAAIDPDAPPVARPRWFGLDRMAPGSPPRLAAWVANTHNIQAHTTPELGVVEHMARNGQTWQVSITPDGSAPLSGAAPLLIQRASPIHPASRLPDLGLRLRRLRIRHPCPDVVARLFVHIELAQDSCVTLEQAAVWALSAEIETPSGLRLLGDA